MFSIRALTITAIIVVIMSVGVFLYIQHDMREFQEYMLPIHQEATDMTAKDSIDTKTQPKTEKVPDVSLSELTQHDSKTESIGITETYQSDETVETLTPKLSQAEIDQTFNVIFSIFDNEFSFNDADPDSMRKSLTEILEILHGNDSRISEFIDLWDEVYDIRKGIDAYNDAGYSNENELFEILKRGPDKAFKNLYDLGIELIQPSEDIKSSVESMVVHWVDRANKAIAVFTAAMVVEESYKKGEITLKDAEDFVNEAAGTDSAELIPLDDESEK